MNKRPFMNEEDEDIFKKLKGDMNIRSFKNHIYFYEDIDTTTILELNTLLSELILEHKKLEIELNVKVPIYLHINSNGGSLLDAMSTVDLIKSSEIPIISIVEGVAASAATLISVVCNERHITRNAMMLVHELSSGGWGRFSEKEIDLKNLSDMMKSLIKIYKKHTNFTELQLQRILKKDRYLNAHKCIKYGLVDKVI